MVNPLFDWFLLGLTFPFMLLAVPFIVLFTVIGYARHEIRHWRYERGKEQ